MQKDVGHMRSFFMWLQDNYFYEASTVNPFAKDSFTYPKHLKKPGELHKRETHTDEITNLLAKAGDQLKAHTYAPIFKTKSHSRNKKAPVNTEAIQRSVDLKLNFVTPTPSYANDADRQCN